MSSATSIASSIVRTASPRGTGRPMLPSTRFVSSLSCAISTAIELVRSVTRRLDAAQVPAQSELHERAVVQPPHRDPASTGLLDDRPRGRPEAHRLVQALQVVDHLVGADRPGLDARADEAGCLVHALDADRLFLVGDDHPPHPLVAGRHDATEADVAPGESLQLERDVLEHVRQVCPLVQPLDEPARRAAAARMLAQRRERREEAIVEPDELRRRQLLERAESDVAGDHRREPPVVRTAERTDAGDAQIVRVHARCGLDGGEGGRHGKGVMGYDAPRWRQKAFRPRAQAMSASPGRRAPRVAASRGFSA